VAVLFLYEKVEGEKLWFVFQGFFHGELTRTIRMIGFDGLKPQFLIQSNCRLLLIGSGNFQPHSTVTFMLYIGEKHFSQLLTQPLPAVGLEQPETLQLACLCINGMDSASADHLNLVSDDQK